MRFNLKETIDKWFELGVTKGDILWFIDKEIRINSQDCVHFLISYIVIIFCCMEVVCQLVVLIIEGREIQHILTYGPMFFISTQVLIIALPLIIQRNTYLDIYKKYWRIYNFEPAEHSTLQEMRELFYTYVRLMILCCFVFTIAFFGFLPYNGLNYDDNIFPVIKALKLLEGFPKWLPIAIILLNYILLMFKAYYLLVNVFHLMHMSGMYVVSNILLRGILRSIAHTKRGLTELKLVEHEEYQHMVGLKLINCVKLDMEIRRFANSQIDYYKWTMLLILPNSILLLSVFAYINMFMAGGDTPIGSVCVSIDANFMALTYGVCSELYLAQVGLNRLTLENTPWYTFSLSNRRTMLILLSNLQKAKHISAGGLVHFNYEVLISVMRKVFNVLTILSSWAKE
ncbi:uncharacterized protein [Euwallacea fornicatus]|uniref:uncharacterized protein n=1 Tax=Euwallacea fornicatus TaxID=995702 RepID=UPI00339058AB